MSGMLTLVLLNKMPDPLLIFSQSDYLIQVVEKPTDLGLHCLQRQGISRLCRTRVKESFLLMYMENACGDVDLILQCTSGENGNNNSGRWHSNSFSKKIRLGIS